MPKQRKKTDRPKKSSINPLSAITENTKLAEILEYPLVEDVLRKYDFPCLSCPMAKFEIDTLTLGQVSGAYGLDLENMIRELNSALKVYTKKES
ncbi:MAG TPA: DUF1858 domain-containing protein [Candidatus Paceibacterota bacterium]|nr:DUF1858 domain-containing protein [Candidatus Pacearchaeota archaeon]HRZ50501.1 DUF1858 domain-containing protein [Candidatus Paceibacterota bacterium]HSA36222.1 DUF1858 domain-containing protein [Candidatus Paceibacterota bacterium]